MWTREHIKQKAKNVLKFNYWKAFIVSIVIMIAGGNYETDKLYRYIEKSEKYNNYPAQLIENILLFIAIISIIIIILRVLVGYMIEVGGRKFFIKSAEGEVDMGYLGYCFKKDRYSSVLLTMLLRSIYTILWTLLLIIPGIIKSYAYRMVPYILADNPNIGYNRAIELSNQMTRGEKWNIFVLKLSFIGWYLLGALALLIGVLFVKPYEDATNAELYLVLRENAISRGLTSYEELNITHDYN
ncbi:DUF975 family protein [Gottschalkia acidurici]|nr:DUF975 family protein [Gottschalkia acidurici]